LADELDIVDDFGRVGTEGLLTTEIANKAMRLKALTVDKK
jgi:hypothetical protein